MIPTTSETTTMDFNCPAVARVVKITREYAVQVTRSGKFLGRAVANTDCTDKDHCPVARAGGGDSPYDWSRCVFLHPAAS